MPNKNQNLIISYFPDWTTAQKAVEHLKHWDKSSEEIKLGGIGILSVDAHGNLKTHKVGTRAAGIGAKWGMVAGLVAGILSGGLTVIGGAVAGLAAGSVTGALFHRRLGMSDQDRARLENHLSEGGAAVAVMADDDEVGPTKFQLDRLGGAVENYVVPAETLNTLEAGDEAPPRQAVLHYHRPAGDYEGWGIHLWTGYPEEVLWENPVLPSGQDDFGLIFEVPLTPEARQCAYILHRGDEKDLLEDQVLDLAVDGYEVWIVQSRPGYAPPPND